MAGCINKMIPVFGGLINPFSAEAEIFQLNQVNTMVADAMHQDIGNHSIEYMQ